MSLTGEPNQGEIWTLKLGTASYSYAVLYGDSLATIAASIGSLLPLNLYNVSVLGRVITITSTTSGAPVSARLSISPDSQGGAVVTAQLVFDSTNWNQLQTVYVQGVNNDIVDGGDALVFAPMTNRVDQIRGPVIIDGGVSANPEPFLHNPLMLPGETNLPLPDGTLTTPGTTLNGAATITDLYATNVNLLTGERPGFDPRMNDFAYTTPVPERRRERHQPRCRTRSRRTSSRSATTTPFAVSVSQTGNGTYQFIGTPQQSMVDSTNAQLLDVSTLTVASALKWIEAQLSLTGLPNVGDVWKLVLVSYNAGGTVTSTVTATYTVQPGDEVASRVALQASRSSSRRPTPSRRASVSSATAACSSSGSTAPRSRSASASSRRPGTTANGHGAGQRHAARLPGHELDGRRASGSGRTGNAGTVWSFRPAATPRAATRRDRGDIGALAHEDRARAPVRLRRHSSPGRRSRSGPAGLSTQHGNPRVPATGDQYVVKPLNLNTRVDEDDAGRHAQRQQRRQPGERHRHADRLDADRSRHGRPRRSSAARSSPGGITYASLEALNIALGSGNNTFTVESTHSGTTTVTSGDGNDTIRVKTTGGHTTIDTGAGNDLVTVSSDQALASSSPAS